MEVGNLFQQHLFFCDVDVESISALFEWAFKRLSQENLVEKTYLQGLMTREETFPTGLMTQYVNIAIPHTDPCHIIKPFICVVRTKKPLIVKQMGDNQEITVSHFFFLGIKALEGFNQVSLLATMMALFSNQQFVQRYQAASTITKMYELIQSYIHQIS